MRIMKLCSSITPVRPGCQARVPGTGRPVPGTVAVAGQPSQASTLSGLSEIHLAAASSEDMPSLAMYFATVFWSSLVHLNFLTRSTAGEPASTHFVEATLVNVVSG